jgi:hypothetical protein
LIRKRSEGSVAWVRVVIRKHKQGCRTLCVSMQPVGQSLQNQVKHQDEKIIFQSAEKLKMQFAAVIHPRCLGVSGLTV